MHQAADGDGPLRGVGTVGIGRDHHLVAEGFADEWNQLFAAAHRSLGVRHATAELKLDGLCFGDGNVALQVFDRLFCGDVALAIGLVDVDLGL